MTAPAYDRAAPIFQVLDAYPVIVSPSPSHPLPPFPQRRVRAVLASPARRLSDAAAEGLPLTLYVFADLAPPTLIYRADVLPPDSYPSLSRTAPLRLRLAAAPAAAPRDAEPPAITLSADGSCGCGSKLKNWRPFDSFTRARP